MEELKQLLSWSLLELERSEARLLHLQEMLTATRTERDEARKQLSNLGVDYCNIVTNTQKKGVTSMDRSQCPDTILAGADLNVDPYSTLDYDSSPHQFLWNSTPAHHFDLPPEVYLHRLPTSDLEFECSNLMELKDQPFYDQNGQQLSLVERQDQPFYDQNGQQLSLVERQQSDVQQQFESHLLASPPSILGSTMSAHLPEPPEANLEVRQDTLPEKGKLLQAVMQAGPLLQTLLLTGQLPQWRHPPPTLDSVELPKISMSSFPNSPPPIGPLVHHRPSAQGPADALHVNSAASSPHHSLCPRTTIKKSPISAVSTSAQSSSAAALSSSKLLLVPVLNSLDSAITRSPALKFAEINRNILQ